MNVERDGRAFNRLDLVALYVLMPVTAFVLSSTAASLWLSFSKTPLSANGSTEWQVLNNVAGFWNGHFAAASLIVLAWSVFLQTRALNGAIKVEQLQLRAIREERFRWQLERIEENMGRALDHFCAIVAWEVDGVYQARKFTGLGGMVRACRFADEGRDTWHLISYDYETIDQWLRLLDQKRRILAEIRRLSDSVAADDSCDLNREEEERLRHHVAMRVKDQRDALTQVSKWLEEGKPDTDEALAQAKALIDLGWRFQQRTEIPFAVFEATKLDLDQGLVQVIFADEQRKGAPTAFMEICSQIASFRVEPIPLKYINQPI